MTTANQGASIVAMFGRIAGVYDFLNHFLSLGIDRYWRRELTSLVRAREHGLVADLAAGTLDVALAILKRHPTVRIPAIDFCLPMLLKGLPKIDGHGAGNILPCCGDANRLPLASSSVDSITMAFGIRNINPRLPALDEMLRVLVPGGRVCILEFGSGRDRIWGGVYNVYLNRILPGLAALFSRDRQAYEYLAGSICQFPAAEELAAEMASAGFEDIHYRRLSGGIVCLHWGHKPA